ncbi:MAG: hypothetical protein KKA99_01425 [Gammaproteobacteria bacterium]|nr:hypothetical protein [Gammaproteobacteria bacterium]
MKNNIIYLKCPPIEEDRVSSVHAAIETWVRSSALSQLIDSFGSKVPNELDLDSLVTWLLNFSEQWDFRRLQQEAVAKDIGEGARWLLNDSHLTPRQQNLIEDSAKIIGLIGISEPTRQSYDYVLVLGGARLSCLLRPRLAAKMMKERHIQPKAIVLLASSRPVADSEREATDTYALNAVDEFDLLNAGAEMSFQIIRDFTEEHYDDPINVNRNWVIRRYSITMKLPPIVSMSAPSSEPDKRRANSADTYEFFFSKFNVSPGSSLLLVTSQIYVPYQQLEAIRTLALPRDVIVETVGFPPVWGGKLQGMTGPSNYLQEIRSTIQSAHRFLKLFPKKK